MLPEGKPHKKPNIIAIDVSFGTLNIFENTSPSEFDILLNTSADIASSDNIIKGRREGSKQVKNILTLFFTDSRLCFDITNRVISVVKKIKEYIMLFELVINLELFLKFNNNIFII
ncbi:hypothetical protein D3C71_1903810 [compost metagenome]